MCGIAGIISTSSYRVSEQALSNFLKPIKHRGPDAEGAIIYNNGQLGLGHQRLSILDLSASANQPMQSFDKKISIVYNGEVFNFIEIKVELERKGYSFKTNTDTEVIINSYLEWGTECFSKFNGMWAMAIYEHKTGDILLCRDRFGIKPLFFLKENNRFSFASETNCFKSLENYSRSFNIQVIEKSISNPYYASQENTSIFDNINSLKPGHWLRISTNGQIEEKCWYNLRKRCAQNPTVYTEGKFKELFLDAVKIRLRSDVGIATAFSGGLDSTAVFSSIKHLASNPNVGLTRLPENWQTAFSVAVPEDPEIDDWPYAEKALEELKAKYIKLETKSSSDLLDDLIKDSAKADCILGTPINIISQIYAGMKQHGFTVSMDGHGADEYLFGYRNMVNELYYSSLQRSGKRQSKRISAALSEMYHPSEIEKKQKQFKQEIKMSYKTFNYFKRLTRNTFNPVNSAKEIVTQNLLKSPLPGLLHTFDKASMMSGIEIRMPFMDYRLIEYCYGLHNKYFINKGVSKWILRNELTDIIPNSVLKRKHKIGIGAPINQWLKSSNQENLKDILNNGPQKNILTELEHHNPSDWFKLNLQSIET